MDVWERNKKLTLTVAEAAELLGVSLPTAYELAHSEGFPTLRIGRKLLISRVGLESWVDRRASNGMEDRS